MDLITITGIFASAFTDLSLLPQLIKMLKKKKADDVSFGMLIVLFIGLVLWIFYGILKTDYIIIISNSVSLIINILTMILSLKYKSR